jgi:hypothetical protein
VVAIAALGCVLSTLAGCGLTAATPLPATTPLGPVAGPVDPLSVAHLEGTWDVTTTITAVTGHAPPLGAVSSAPWVFAPACPSGPCDVTITLPMDLGYLFAPASFRPPGYSGHFDSVLPCGGGSAEISGTVQLAVTAVAGAPSRASALAGTYHRIFTAGANAKSCTDDTVTVTFQGTPHP